MSKDSDNSKDSLGKRLQGKEKQSKQSGLDAHVEAGKVQRSGQARDDVDQDIKKIKRQQGR